MNIFGKLGLSPELLKTINKMGFEKPSQIQELAIPHIIKGENVIGESATGSGKTLAFGCGIIEKVVVDQGLQALVLTPTRELAEQVTEVIRELGYSKRLNVMSIYGGVSINPQIQKLRNANVVVATPGRLLDHLDRRTINLSKVKIFVLDEVDRMFDMGFITEVQQIINACPQKKQNLFFSATVSGRVQDLANYYMKEHIKVSATKMVDPTKLEQVYFDVDRKMKFSLLVHLLKKEKSGLVLVFCNTKRNTDLVAKNLKSNGVKAVAIHGGFAQNKRTKTIELFNKGKFDVLVCTDVVSRGLHINDVSHVYNFDIPKVPTDYVHRIGRTARAGCEGKVINLLCDYDHENFTYIVEEYSEFDIEGLQIPRVERVAFMRVDNSRSEGRNSFGRDNSYDKNNRRNSFDKGSRSNSFGRDSKRNFYGRDNRSNSFQRNNNSSSRNNNFYSRR